MTHPLTLRDNNTTVDVKVGQPVRIVLQGNPTTGYRWTRLNFEKREKLGDADMEVLSEFQVAPSEPGMVGAGGEFHVTATAKRPGKHTLEMVYVRPFEGNKPGGRRFTLHLRAN